MTTDMDNPAQNDQTMSSLKILHVIENQEQKESLHHPIRRQILRILSAGIDDYETEITTDVQTLEDGTGLTRSIEVKRPIQRYWMAVPEIVERLGQGCPELKVTNYQCYYHLQKLEEQGLVEQDPPPKFDTNGRKKRTRGLQFRSAARFFIYRNTGFPRDDPNPCLEFLHEGWGLEPSVEDCEQLAQLISEQDQSLFGTLKHLMKHMDVTSIDIVSFSLLLDRLAHVFLSDDDRFIERYRDAKRILVRSGGGHLDVVGPSSIGDDDANEKATRGKNDE